MVTRPHILIWQSGTSGGIDLNTGYALPDVPGVQMQIECRYKLKTSRTYMLDDGTTVEQNGSIRLDVGVELPQLGQEVEVPGYFKGKVMDIYRGQLSYRVDV